MIIFNKIFIFVIYIYKFLISPFLTFNCRFSPTCSVYAIKALEKHKLFFALFLIFFRILRCNPFFKGGYDPIV